MPEETPTDRPPEDLRTGLRHRAAGWITSATTRAEDVTERVEAWADRQHPKSGKGVVIGWFLRYRDADGQLYALLLAAYLFVTVLPASLAMATYADSDPTALADNLNDRLGLTGATASLTQEVLAGAGGHQLTATLIAVVSVLTFGLGIPRTLQLVHGRVWKIPPKQGLADSARYLVWLLVVLFGSLLYVLQETLLKSAGGWVEWVLAPLWVIGVAGVLAWTPVFLLHGRVTARQALPGAVLATVGLVALRILSSFKLADWMNWYSKYYGGIGIVMAIFFWLVIGTTILVIAAALSPAYAVRAGESGVAGAADDEG